MGDRLVMAIIAALIVAAPLILYFWQGKNGGIG